MDSCLKGPIHLPALDAGLQQKNANNFTVNETVGSSSQQAATPIPFRKRNRREYIRAWRKKAKAGPRTKIPPELRESDSGDITCLLCFESFETGAAYIKHFKERKFGPGEVHVCLSREEMREWGSLIPNWETGSWQVRRPATGYYAPRSRFNFST